MQKDYQVFKTEEALDSKMNYDIDENLEIKQESSNDPLEFQNFENEFNPWAVENVSAFLKYLCPECDFNDSDLSFFANHAVVNHRKSTVLFSTENQG